MSRLFVDMDGTLAKFHDEADYLERMYEENFFSDLSPFDNMVAGIKLFMLQHPDVEVYVISSCVESPFCKRDKNRWLDQHLDIPEDRRIFPPVGASKADYIPGGVTKEDHLLDDYNRGLNQFLYDGGSAIKCHNNINQQGLGAYGGSAGNLWVGPMVHTDDRPELIAAELAQHMGLSFDLETVKAAYGLSDTAISGTAPLDEIRRLTGNEDFTSWTLNPVSGPQFSVPAYKLRDICLNMFGDHNFAKHLLQDDLGVFRQQVAKALEEAKLPLVGRLDYLDGQGGILRSKSFRSQEDMQNELCACWDTKTPIRYHWFVKTKPLSRTAEKRASRHSAQKKSSPKKSLAAKIADAAQRSASDGPAGKDHSPNR